jgi:hypothetical protein
MEYNLKTIVVSFNILPLHTKHPVIRSYAVDKMSLHRRQIKFNIPYFAQLLYQFRIKLVNPLMPNDL